MMVAFDLNQIQKDFIRYAKVNTRSDAGSTTVPTTPGQTKLANMLVGELQALGLTDAALNPANGFVTATIPATTSKAVPSIGFIAHLDTADYAADDVAPQLHPNYQGAPIQFANGLALTVEQFPGLRRYFGETLITGDGTTLLGVDDKAGIAAAMALARVLVAGPTIEHGVVKLAFGPDEEIGKGADRFDAKGFATDFAYTLDNGDLGQIEYETFNAAQAVITFTGTSVHPGEAKGSLVNALTLAERLDAALPTYERPEYTADMQGFFLLLELSGTIGTAQARYIIRDFDRANFAARKATLAQAVASLNAGFAEPRISYTLEDQYYNMADIIAKDQTPLRLAEAGIRAVGLTPHTIPFRGGTDGSKITYQGIPTPNLFNGGMNFHGPYEVVSTEAMGKVAETLLAIVKLNAEH
ncbi:peptidase T [Lacticaseibacillus nasuensis]|uniref:peptidase T n=1 Tax=Lacticaseibacillus nasuensis TaxID=944671 RepID=UPI00224792D2|nr:peptidase T [Lacticaseibacillus nasuensis]MCX2456548.1 peptidase T [Lacticaseibacillus nasuensis]